MKPWEMDDLYLIELKAMQAWEAEARRASQSRR